MSVTTHLSGNPDKLFLKSLHRRKDSGELDVFEAARYFSGTNELPYNAAATYEASLYHSGRRGGRMSLDLPIRTNVIPLPQPPYTAEKPSIKDPKKHRQQPSSPGGRLANFLNSLFNQSSSKKKKKPKNQIKNEDLHHEIGGRKRRSSLSSLIDSKPSSNSSKISGFRTPPAPANCCTIQTPNKNYKEIRNLLDQKRAAHNPKNLGNGINKKSEMMRKIKDETEEGTESDSSSDLFELRICDNFDCYSSTELPVYQTTNIQSINKL